jgi:4-amino-4-deoxy-L-arabinose transferase-like glycosyltransferase
MVVLQLLLIALLLPICSFGPGLFFVRWLRWKPAETLCASVALSLVIVYLGSLAIYCLNWQIPSHWFLVGFCLLLTFLARRDLARICGNRQVRRMIRSTAILWIWTTPMLLVIRHYAGGTWSGDWLEHFQRSSFFLSHGDLHYRFIGQYLLTDRPPVMNLICAHYLAITSTQFEPYQFTAASLNLVAILPASLFATSLVKSARARRGAMAALVLLFACNPMFVQNATYTWTKPLAAFFALLGLWLYLRGWMKNDRIRIILAFFSLAAGCLVHFYIVPWAGVIFLHYLIAVWRRRWNELFKIATFCGLLFATWFGWAIYQYGSKTTFTSNLTISDHTSHTFADRAVKIGTNLLHTIVPYFLRPTHFQDLQQSDRWGWIRDLAFCLYQTNAFLALGSVGVFVLAWAILKTDAFGKLPAKLKRFWMIFIPISAILAIAAAPVAEDFGVAHLALQPHILLGLAVLAGVLGRMGGPWKILISVGCTIDFLLGILLHIHLEHRIFDVLINPDGSFTVPPSPDQLSHAAQYNFVAKEFVHLNFIGDLFPQAAGVFELAICAMFVAMIVVFLGKSPFRRPL